MCNIKSFHSKQTEEQPTKIKTQNKFSIQQSKTAQISFLLLEYSYQGIYSDEEKHVMILKCLYSISQTKCSHTSFIILASTTFT